MPPFLQPIADDETKVSASEARARRVPAGSHRTRVISYSGYGSAGFPVIEVPEAYATAHPELRNLTWAEQDGRRILLAPNARTMAINTRMDLAADPDPPAPRKFSPDHPDRVLVVVDTAEEWVLYNPSLTLWGHTDRAIPAAGRAAGAIPLLSGRTGRGWARFWKDHEFRIVTHAADHPFHIHVNPMWVMRIEVPDEQGRLHNLLAEPRWMD